MKDRPDALQRTGVRAHADILPPRRRVVAVKRVVMIPADHCPKSFVDRFSGIAAVVVRDVPGFGLVRTDVVEFARDCDRCTPPVGFVVPGECHLLARRVEGGGRDDLVTRVDMESRRRERNVAGVPVVTRAEDLPPGVWL